MAPSLFLDYFWLMLLLNFRRFLNPLRLALFLAWVFVMGVWSAQAQTATPWLGPAKASHVVQTPQVKASLLAYAPQGIAAGQTLWLGLQLQHQPHWHTYWRNPGDSGLPTELTWQLPAGVKALPLIWPAPQTIPIGPMANFGYEDTVLLVTPLQIDKGFKQAASLSTLDIQLHANWLVCKQECIPQEGDFQLSIPLQGATVMASAEFQKALAQQARTLKGNHTARIADDGRTIQLSIAALPDELKKGPWTVLPQTANVVQNNAAPLIQGTSQDGQGLTQVQVKVSSERMDSPKDMLWLLVQGKANAPTGLQWSFNTPVLGQWQTFTDVANTTTLPAVSVVGSTPTPWATWALALLGALAGGLLLNLMPCVFPVLAIKLLNITQHADSRQEMKLSAWSFTAGVLISFLLLGGLMLALRAAGSQLGWGFQLQSPWVVGGLAMLFAVMGLNLSGLFEFGSFVPSSLAGIQWSKTWANSLWSGVFAVVIASPCTAPFMGASLGLAIGLPAWQALPIFAAMGIGMSLPFIAVTFSTAWVNRLPRPGAWMLTFKQFMAFPMFATVIWLVWVLGQQVGMEGVTGFLICLLSLAFMLWAVAQQGQSAWALRSFAALVLLGALWQWGSSWTHVELESNNLKGQSGLASDTASASNAKGTQASSGLIWEAWSEDKVAQARAAGQPVFVDFTAAWCVTCQFNKKTTFRNPTLISDFAQKKVLLLRADWTRYDPAITQALNALGRNGVPVYAWYAPGQNVQLLSELPSVSEIQNSLSQVKASP
jgi:thiol:disulfide interchange protein DsbD